MKFLPHRLLLISAVLACLMAPLEAQQTRHVLPGHVRPAVTSRMAKSLGQMPLAELMNLSIVLPLRNQDRLHELLDRLYAPSDPMYRKFLSVAEFTDQFGPTEADYQAVVQFARANGMTVTGRPANRLVVPVTASVDTIQTAFHVGMNLYRHPTEDRTFFSPDRDPQVPQGLSIVHIAGLNNYSLPRPMHVKPAHSEDLPVQSQARPAAQVRGSGPDGSYIGSDMRAAYYGGTELTGNGQVVGLLQFDGYDPNDVALTLSSSGETNTIPIKNVLLDGATGAPCQFNPFPCEDAEQVLDIVQAAGMAPGLAEIRVYIGNLDADILNAMASENAAKQLSISWSWTPEDPIVDDVFFQEFAAQGQTVFAASGDFGAFSPNVSNFFYPAEDAFVTSVGGTSLITSGGLGPWVSETAWSFSGGGISPDAIPIADWQAGVANSLNQGSTTLRNIPDVAMEADSDNYVCSMGRCLAGWGGTSFAAPRWAGFTALINQQAAQSGAGLIGFLNPALYNLGKSSLYASTFHDISSGRNDNNGTWPAPQQIFTAVAGYDLVTGWGSPTGQGLIDALAPKPLSGFQLSSSIAQLVIAPGNAGSATITIKGNGEFSGPVNLSVAGLPDGVVPSWSANPASGSSVLTLTVPASAHRGSYLLTVTGTSGATAASATIALIVDAPGFSILPSYTRLGLRPGLAAGTEINVIRYRNFTTPVTLAITSPLPTGVTANWSGNPAQDRAQLTLTATKAAALATTMLTITATAGAETATTSIAVGVGRPGFWLVLNPPPSNMALGGQVTATVSMAPIGSFNEPAALSAVELPAGIIATFSPETIAPGQTSVMTLSAAGSTAPGNYLTTIKAQAATSLSMYTIQYSVDASPVPFFSFIASTLQPIIQEGQSTVINVAVQAVNGFAGRIGMYGIPQLPAGMTYSYHPTTVIPGESTQLTLTAGADTMPGNYVMGIGGQSVYDAATAGTGLYVTIVPPSILSLGLSPSSVSLPQGQSTKMVATLTGAGAAVSNANFVVASGLPTGLSADFSAGQDPGSGVLTLTASSTATAGTYTVNIAGSAGSETVNAPMTIVISNSPSAFSIAASAITVKAGGSAQSTVTLATSNGYSGTLTLFCSVTSSPQAAQNPPTCVAGPNVTLSANQSSVLTAVTVKTSAATSALARPWNRWGGAGGGLALAGLILVIAPKSRRKYGAMLILALLSAVIGGLFISGCGGAGAGSSSNTPSSSIIAGTTPGVYTVTVAATGDDALNTKASATFTLTVQ